MPQKVRVCGSWPRRSQIDLRIADKNDSIPFASCHNRDQGSGPSKAYPSHPLGVLLKEQGPERERDSDGPPCTLA